MTLQVDGREQTAIEMPLLVGRPLGEEGEEEPEAESVQVIRASSNTLPKGAAGAIANIIRLGRRPIVQAIGADAAYVSLKAIVLAQKFLAEEGIDIDTVPNYHEIEIAGRERTATVPSDGRAGGRAGEDLDKPEKRPAKWCATLGPTPHARRSPCRTR